MTSTSTWRRAARRCFALGVAAATGASAPNAEFRAWEARVYRR